VLLGPPGTGKTAELTNRAQACIDSGIPASRVGFVSFTRAAVDEALDRIGGTRDTHPWFRTIHSLGYALAGITQDSMLSEERLKEFSEAIGEPISPIFATSDSADVRALHDARGAPADVALSLYSRAASRDTSLEYEFRREQNLNVSWQHVWRIIEKYKAYKQVLGLWDFADLVTKSNGVLDVDKCFIDEAQDTTRAQWNLLRRTIPKSTDVVFAGDDDQCIYRWSGADPSPLGTIEGQRTVLNKSHRVPLSVYDVAARVAGRIPARIPKQFAPRDGDSGTVESITDLEYVDLRAEGKWLLLARTRHNASQWRAVARYQGVVYQLEDGSWSNSFPEVKAAVAYWELQQGRGIDRVMVDTLYRYLPPIGCVCKSFAEIRALPDLVTWSEVVNEHIDRGKHWWDVLEMAPEDAGYVRALRRNREPLSKAGRIRISTVHRAKGLQEDNVGVLMSITHKIATAPDKLGDELRVMYVALTRARHRMVLAYVPTNYQWSLP
jgi:superfamily I DNA/RNA helicase